MSQYSDHIGQFLTQVLEPEIVIHNIRLGSMEEFGFDNKVMRALRHRLHHLIPVYDFLQEYVDGEEECDWVILRDLMVQTGLGLLSNKTNQPSPAPITPHASY